MADILIKDMEIPKACYWRESKDGYVHTCFLAGGRCRASSYTLGKYGVKPDSCPLIEVPPHGDLISKQETVKNLMDVMCEGCKHVDDCSWCAMAEYRRIVEDAPTVIEASK